MCQSPGVTTDGVCQSPGVTTDGVCQSPEPLILGGS